MDALKKDVEAGHEASEWQTLHWANKIQEISVEGQENQESWLNTSSQLPDVLWDTRKATKGVVAMETRLVQ